VQGRAGAYAPAIDNLGRVRPNKNRKDARRASVTSTYIDKQTNDIFEDTCDGNWPNQSADANCDYFIMANEW
jgi:hypothetical protein